MGILDFLFPITCFGCREVGYYVCPACLNRLPILKNQYCPVCLKPSLNGLTHSRCKTKYTPDGLITLFAFHGLVRTIIAKYKYRFATSLTPLITDLITSYFPGLPDSVKQATLIPIPLHPTRLRWRGFNQAELLSQNLAEYLGNEYDPHLLLRQRNTKPQMSLHAKERRHNLAGAFTLAPTLEVSSVVLVDDVFTTGATMREATKTIKHHVNVPVWCFALAQTLPHSLES